MSGVLELSFLTIILGAKGFTAGGLPFSASTHLNGARGRAVGTACLVLGLAGVVFAFLGSDPAGRERLQVLAQGIIVGVLGAILVLGPPWRERSEETAAMDSPS